MWEQGLAVLGRSELVRTAYEELYASEEYDGSKFKQYFELWLLLGVKPSEVDYAFFLDRSTHFGGPDRDNAVASPTALKECVNSELQRGALTSNGAARRCLARLQPHSRQAEARLARDVAYYLDAYPETALTRHEIEVWSSFIPLTAVHNFGLSDEHPSPSHQTISELTATSGDLSAASPGLTALERTTCPASVVDSVRLK